MLGAVLSIRGRETIIEVWFDNAFNTNTKKRIEEKLDHVLDIKRFYTIFYKDNSKSIKDNSTSRNAEQSNDLNYNGKRKSSYY